MTPADIAQALTWARTNPSEVIAALRERVKLYKGKDFFPPERNGSCVVTKEGTAVVEEAMKYMEALEPLGGVGVDSEPGLALAAEDHVTDIGFTGAVSHNSSDGTNGYQRVSRYGKMKVFGESLWYGSPKADARCMVLDLIVDDGVASRGHRLCVLDPKYDIVGCAYGPHATFGTVSAMEFAKAWEPNDMAIAARVQSGPVRPAGQEESMKQVQTQWKVIGTCPVCKEPIRGGAVMEIEKLGGKLHKACFNCMECSKPLPGQPFNVHQKLPYCKECYHEKYGDKCVACGKAVTGGMVKCALGVLHIECLICSVCDKSIGKNSFSTAGGVISCQACAGGSSLGVAAKAGGPSSAMAKAGGVASRGAAKAKAKVGGPGSSGRPLSGSRPGSSGATPGSSTRPGSSGSGPMGRGPSGPPAKAGFVAPPGAGGRVAAAKGKAEAKAQPKGKAPAKVSLAKAGASVIGLGMDYGNL